MADAVVVQDPPAVVVAPVVPAVAPPAAPSTPQGDPAWLPDRIAQAKRSAEADLLKSLGFATPEEAKAAGAAAKAAADANKTAEQRAADATAAAAAEKARADGALSVVSSHATRELAKLTPERLVAVKAIAGDDPGKQLAAIDALLPTWTASAPPAPVVVPGANTSTAGGSPPPATTVKPNLIEVRDVLEKQNPMAAAHFALRNARELYKGETPAS